MAIIVGDGIDIDRDSISPDSIAAATEILTHRLLDKAASKGWAVDWATTRITIKTDVPRLKDTEARVVIEADMLS